MNTPTHILPSSRSVAASGARRRSRGFTLVELVAVVAVAGVLAGVGAPPLHRLVKSTQLNAATNDLASSFMMARSEAAKRNSRVALCKSTDGRTCARDGGWEQGWIVFHDANNNGTHEAGEDVVLRAQALRPDLRLTGNLNVARYVSFAPNGQTKLAGGGFQAGTITLCNHSAQAGEARQIVLGSAGRARIQKTAMAYCS